MRSILTVDEIVELRTKTLFKLINQLNIKEDALKNEENNINQLIMHAHNVKSLSMYNNDDIDGEKLRILRSKLFNYCIYHIKRYKLIKIEIDDIKNKLELLNIDVDIKENYINKLIK